MALPSCVDREKFQELCRGDMHTDRAGQKATLGRILDLTLPLGLPPRQNADKPQAGETDSRQTAQKSPRPIRS